MRPTASVFFIFAAIIFYGAAFMDDSNASRRAVELRDQHRMVPQPRKDEVVVVPDPSTEPRILIAPSEEAPLGEFADPAPPPPSPSPAEDKILVAEAPPEPATPSTGSSVEIEVAALDPETIVGDPNQGNRPATMGGPQEAAARGQKPPEIPPHVKREDEIELDFKTGDGKAWKAYVKRERASVFLESTLAYIEERRKSTKERVGRQLDLVFQRAFHDRDAAVEEYADWFFGFFTSPQFAVRGMLAGLWEIPSLDVDTIMDAVRVAVEEFMREAYIETVLKPEIRDPEIIDGVRDVLTDAHADYRRMLEHLDTRVVAWIGDNARYVELIDTDEAIQLKLDWNAESWRAPLHRADDAALFGLGGISIIVGGTLAGDFILDTFGSVFGAVIAEAVVGAEAAAGGAIIGSEIPVLGTILGAATGIGAHAVLGYFRENMTRDDFVAETNLALDTTIKRWKELITPKTNELVDRWYDETQRVVATPNLEAKLGS